MKVSSPILINALNYASKPFKWIANSKPMQMACNKFDITPEKAMAFTTIASIIGKDSIGCYMYVKQSLNNEKIPEEKRSFVAALDLTNGGLMILSQLLMFFSISNKKVQKAIFGKIFNKVFSEKSKNLYTTYLRSQPGMDKVSKAQVDKAFNSIRTTSEDTFSFLTSLIASTTIAKRIIVPFIATPMASWAQEKILNKGKITNKPKENKTDIVNNEKSEHIKSFSAQSNVNQTGNLLSQYLNK